MALLSVGVACLALLSGYLLSLAAVALWARPAIPPPGPARRRFAVLIPAHDEATLIERLLDNLRQVDYPSSQFDLYVAADNCSDDTADRARVRGAHVYERSQTAARGKGAALHWLLTKVQESGEAYDAYVVLDADSVVSPNLPRRLDARLEAGSEVIQAYYGVLNTDASPVSGLRHIALVARHHLRPRARSALGLSCGLVGNGMCFAAGVLRRFGWQWFSLTEDVEFHLGLVRKKVRVDFAPEIQVLAEMPVTLSQAVGQNMRWERGRLAMVRGEVPAVLAAGVVGRSPILLDAALDQLIPPLSVLFTLGGACLATSVALGSAPLAVVSAVSLVAQIVYLLAGLALVRAPVERYFAFVFAPFYIAWKGGLYLRVLFSRDRAGWVRTPRRTPGGSSASRSAGRVSRADAQIERP